MDPFLVELWITQLLILCESHFSFRQIRMVWGIERETNIPVWEMEKEYETEWESKKVSISVFSRIPVLRIILNVIRLEQERDKKVHFSRVERVERKSKKERERLLIMRILENMSCSGGWGWGRRTKNQEPRIVDRGWKMLYTGGPKYPRV